MKKKSVNKSLGSVNIFVLKMDIYIVELGNSVIDVLEPALVTDKKGLLITRAYVCFLTVSPIV